MGSLAGGMKTKKTEDSAQVRWAFDVRSGQKIPPSVTCTKPLYRGAPVCVLCSTQRYWLMASVYCTQLNQSSSKRIPRGMKDSRKWRKDGVRIFFWQQSPSPPRRHSSLWLNAFPRNITPSAYLGLRQLLQW